MIILRVIERTCPVYKSYKTLQVQTLHVTNNVFRTLL